MRGTTSAIPEGPLYFEDYFTGANSASIKWLLLGSWFGTIGEGRGLVTFQRMPFSFSASNVISWR
jgi:hypothetical protein